MVLILGNFAEVWVYKGLIQHVDESGFGLKKYQTASLLKTSEYSFGRAEYPRDHKYLCLSCDKGYIVNCLSYVDVF